MAYHLDDTIVAIASPPGGAARGIVRLSGPQVAEYAARLFRAEDSSPSDKQPVAPRGPTVVAGNLHLASLHSPLPAELYLWPERRSYTGQPVAEFHTLGSPPLLDALIEAVCASGARLAEPGEFTLRAFMTGRIDLTQAEAVLGVIDATDPTRLDAALEQLAGGLSRPLLALRTTLFDLLCHLEAAFDFPEEDVSFITREQLAEQLTAAHTAAVDLSGQLRSRRRSGDTTRVVLVGEPNAGKSSLFNALAQRTGAMVSHYPGTTRDYVSAEIDLAGTRFTLIDTAGVDQTGTTNDDESIQHAAVEMARHQSNQADVRVHCVDISRFPNAQTTLHGCPETPELDGDGRRCRELLVLTKADLVELGRYDTGEMREQPDVWFVSSTTGLGLDTLRTALCEVVTELQSSPDHAVATTAARCGESLHSATDAIGRAGQLVRDGGGEELVAAEIRTALDAIGRVAGVVYTDDVLDSVFHRFCIGK